MTMTLALFLLSFAALGVSVTFSLNEAARQYQYYLRNHTWPLPHYVPDEQGWNRLMNARFGQILEMEDREQRYEAFVQTLHSAFLAPNFTEFGFGLTRAPDDLVQELKYAVMEGLPTARDEQFIDAIEGPQSKFIDRPDLMERVLNQFQPLAEKWAGVELIPHDAYGFRLYQNNSNLLMHIDRMETHVISFILHVDSSRDAKPWPIFIEDFHGSTHEVILAPGDLLLYESSKCFHGRPRKFEGSWYTSVFAHYYPKDWQEIDRKAEAEYAVPIVWKDPPREKTYYEPLQMVGTCMKHPTCKDQWCPTEHTFKWSGPGLPGVIIAPNMEQIPIEDHDEL